MNALLVASRSPEPNHGEWSPIGRLEFEGGLYRFVYTRGARTARGFTPFSGMEDLDEIYESERLFPVFANRLLPESRPEYEAYLRWSGFDSASQPDPIAVLAVTEGIRRTDMIE
ncbi:MAG: restriction endonuclease, partial [Verrucomicrobiae bacterium]|nr:restriction endonuclease [Verrucomicrobiae bacterium]